MDSITIIDALKRKGIKSKTVNEVLTVEVRVDSDGYIDFFNITLNIDKIKLCKNCFGEYKILKGHSDNGWYNITWMPDSDGERLLESIESCRSGRMGEIF